MRRSRAALVALVGTVALTAVFGGWLLTGQSETQARTRALREAPLLDASRSATELANLLGAELEAVRTSEDARPYFEYQNLFHDPRGASSGLSVTPSPLVERTADPLLSAHFHVDPKGTLTIPSINEEFPELSDPARLADNRRTLMELRAVKRSLGAELVSEAPKPIADPPTRRETSRRSRPTRRKAPARATTASKGAATTEVSLSNDRATPQKRPQRETRSADAPASSQTISPAPPAGGAVQRIDPEAFQQNANANLVFRNVRAAVPEPPRRRQRRPRAQKPATTPGPIEIHVSSFGWRTTAISGEPRIVSLRTVTTPSGTLAQGFVVDSDAVNEWLDARSEAKAALDRSTSRSRSTSAAPVPGIPGWFVTIDASAAIDAAEEEASHLRTRFWWVFLPALLLAVVGMALVVWVVFRAERLAQERSRFASAAAHELRTPLAGLQLYGEMLAEGLGDPSQAETYARRIADEASRLGRVVNNVLDFARFERGTLRVEAREGDVAAATRRAVDRLRNALEASGMKVRTEIPDSIAARFDEDALGRIVANLLDNAEKYSRDAQERCVRITVEKRGAQVVVAVTDSGHGVATEARTRIFRPFRRESPSDHAAGLGLGLALARTLARDQGGDLTCAETDQDTGARFELWLQSA